MTLVSRNDYDLSNINLINFHSIIRTEGEKIVGLEFCVNHRLLPPIISHDCLYCDGLMKPRFQARYKFGVRFGCNKCEKVINISQDTWFFNSKLDIEKNLLLIYLWTMKIPANKVGPAVGLNKNTITDWFNFIRDVRRFI